jgi:hypothetical protein
MVVNATMPNATIDRNMEVKRVAVAVLERIGPLSGSRRAGTPT